MISDINRFLDLYTYTAFSGKQDKAFQNEYQVSRAQFPEDMHTKFRIVQFWFCPLQQRNSNPLQATVGRSTTERFCICCAYLLGIGF